MENRYRINYDIKQRCVTNAKFKQGDVDSAALEVTLYDNSQVVDITGETIEFRFLKPDNTVVFQDITAGVKIVNSTGGVVECTLKSNTLAAVGAVKCEILRSKDGKRLTTPSFYFTVEESIGEGGVLSTNYISAIENKILEWEQKETARQNAFVANEASRQNTFNTNEANRQAGFNSIKEEYGNIKGIMIDSNNAANLQNQINGVSSQLAENTTKTLTTSMPVSSLSDCVDGITQIDSIKGRTLKNELTYNPTTWAEWTKSGGVVGDSTGLEFTSSVATVLSNIALRIKPFTKYGFLLNVVSNSISSYKNFFSGGGVAYPFNGVLFLSTNSQIGNIKKIATSSSDFTINSILLALSNDQIGTKIKLKDIRIFELPTGSEIEADFNTMSADELALKYPFQSGIASTGEAEGNKIEVLLTGKNLCKGWEIGYIEHSTGVNATNSKWMRTIDYIPVKPSASIKFGNFPFTISDQFTIFYDVNKKYISSSESTSVTIPSNCVYVKICVYKSTTVYTSDLVGQVEYGTIITTYEPYKEDKISLTLKESLRAIQNTADEILASQNKLIRRIGKTILNGSEIDWMVYGNILTNTINFMSSSALKNKANGSGNLICNNFSITSWNTDNEGILGWDASSAINIRINKTKLTPYGFIKGTTSTYVPAFKAWLQANNTIVYHELATPVEEDLNIPSLKCFKGGTLQLNNAIAPTVTIKYPSSISGRMFNVEFELDRLGDSYFNTLKSLLFLAGKELEMRNLVSLNETATLTQTISAVNEIITIWQREP